MTTDAVSRSNAADRNAETIVRYTLGERVNHWLGALSYTYLLMTGLAFRSDDRRGFALECRRPKRRDHRPVHVGRARESLARRALLYLPAHDRPRLPI